MQNNEEAKVELNLGSVDDVVSSQAEAIVDLAFNVTETDYSFRIDLEYCTDLFKKESAEKIAEHYIRTLKSITSDVNQTISDIDIAADEEIRLILDVYNNTYSDYPRNKTVVDLIESQAAEIPDNIALIFENSTMTYSQLNNMANSLAHALINEGVGRGQRVALSVERNLMLPVAILAVLKTGAAYSPIDASLPAERIGVMLKDINPICILTEDGMGFEEFGIKNIRINDESIYQVDSSPVQVRTSPDDTAYIMYTSGTTGTPKGIIISHKALMCDVNSFVKTYNVNRNTVCLQQGSYTFDLFVEEIYPTLCHGGKVLIM